LKKTRSTSSGRSWMRRRIRLRAISRRLNRMVQHASPHLLEPAGSWGGCVAVSGGREPLWPLLKPLLWKRPPHFTPSVMFSTLSTQL
jgi:hypothetical protein